MDAQTYYKLHPMSYSKPHPNKPHTYTSRNGPFAIGLFWGKASVLAPSQDTALRDFVVNAEDFDGIGEMPAEIEASNVGVVVMLGRPGSRAAPTEITSLIKERHTSRFIGGSNAVMVPGWYRYNALALVITLSLSLLVSWKIALPLSLLVSAIGYWQIHQQTGRVVEEAKQAASVAYRTRQSLQTKEPRPIDKPAVYEVTEESERVA